MMFHAHKVPSTVYRAPTQPQSLISINSSEPLPVIRGGRSQGLSSSRVLSEVPEITVRRIYSTSIQSQKPSCTPQYLEMMFRILIAVWSAYMCTAAIAVEILPHDQVGYIQAHTGPGPIGHAMRRWQPYLHVYRATLL